MLNIPKTIENILDKIKVGYQNILQENLVGIYIHGSIAMNCFNPETSDIDFLVIVKNKLDIDLKKRLLNYF